MTADSVLLANEKEALRMSNVKEVKYRIKKDCEAAAKWRIVFDLRFPRYYLLREVSAKPKPFNRHNNVSKIQQCPINSLS